MVEVLQGTILQAPGTTGMSCILVLHEQYCNYPLPQDLFEITGNSETSFIFTQQQSRRQNRGSRDWPWKCSHLHHSPRRERAQHSRAAFELVQPALPSHGQKSHHVLEAALSFLPNPICLLASVSRTTLMQSKRVPKAIRQTLYCT